MFVQSRTNHFSNNTNADPRLKRPNNSSDGPPSKAPSIDYEAKLNQLESQLNTQKRLIIEKAEENRRLIRSKEDLREKYNSLQQDLHNARAETKRLQAQKSPNNEQLLKLKNNMKEVYAKTVEEQKKCWEEKLKVQAQKHNAEIDAMNKKVENAQKQANLAEQKEKEIEKLKLDLGAKEKEIKKQLAELDDLRNIKNKFSKIEDEYNQLLATSNREKAKTEQLEVDLQGLRRQHNVEVLALHSNISLLELKASQTADLQSQIELLVSDNNAKDKLVGDLQAEVDKLKIENRGLVDNQKVINKKVKECYAQIQEANNHALHVITVQTENERLQRENATRKEELDSLKVRYTEIEQQLNDKSTNEAHLSKMNKELNTKLNQICGLSQQIALISHSNSPSPQMASIFPSLNLVQKHQLIDYYLSQNQITVADAENLRQIAHAHDTAAKKQAKKQAKKR